MTADSVAELVVFILMVSVITLVTGMPILLHSIKCEHGYESIHDGEDCHKRAVAAWEPKTNGDLIWLIYKAVHPISWIKYWWHTPVPWNQPKRKASVAGRQCRWFGHCDQRYCKSPAVPMCERPEWMLAKRSPFDVDTRQLRLCDLNEHTIYGMCRNCRPEEFRDLRSLHG